MPKPTSTISTTTPQIPFATTPSTSAVARDILSSIPAEPNGKRTPEPPQGRATGAGGKPGRMTPDGQFVSTETIVENIRALLADSWTKGDIRRVLVRQFGGTAQSFNRHIALARKRNLAQLGRSPEQSKADSMQQWQRLLVEAQQEKKRCHANLTSTQTELMKARRALDKVDDEANPEMYLTMLGTINHKEDTLKAATKAFESARYHVDKYQNVIDRMLGHRAPEKTENTTNTTLNVKLAKPEPLTLKDADEQLKGMLKKLRSEYEVKEVKNLADRSGDNEAVMEGE